VDYSKYCKSYPNSYYKNTDPDLGVIVCEDSQKLFFEEEYDFANLQNESMPFSGWSKNFMKESNV